MMTNTTRHVRPAQYTCALAAFALLLALGQAHPARAQWTQPAGGSTVYKTDTAGNVGIGTTAPAAKLDVTFDGAAEQGLRIFDTRWAGAENGGHLLFFGNSNGAGAPARFGQIGGLKENGTAGSMLGFLGFYTNNGAGATSVVERMRITSAGNVGIGTTAPAARLHLVGANAPDAAAPLAFSVQGGVGGNSTYAGYAGGGVSLQGGPGGWNTGGGSSLYSGSGGAIDLTGGTGGQHLFGVSNAGAGGAISLTGGTGGEHKVAGYVGGTGGNIVINGGPGGPGSTAGAPGNVILANLRGRVGIGTDAPLGTLHVPGGVVVIGQNYYQGATLRVGRNDAMHPGIVTATNYNDGTKPIYRARSFSAASLSGDGLYTFLAQSDGMVRTFSADHVGNGYFAGSLDAAGGLCIAGVCKSSWSQVGASQWTTSGSNINYAAGSVGIGTAAPEGKLHIIGPTTGNGPTIYAGGGGDVLLAGGGAVFFDGNYNYAAGSYIRPLAANTQGFFTSGLERMRITPAGNVAIGIDNVGNTRVNVRGADSTSSNYSLFVQNSAGSPLLNARNDGRVGIGTTNPQKALDVAGDINATGAITGGSIQARYQDVAEWVPTTQKLSAGTVVVLDTARSNHVLASASAYDTRVAGVISAQPGISLGEAGEGKVLVATTGRVKVKVDASRGAIKIGDLIVTSGIPGVAMKSEPVQFGGVAMHRPGTIIGKALEPLAGGTGEILVLLSMQ